MFGPPRSGQSSGSRAKQKKRRKHTCTVHVHECILVMYMYCTVQYRQLRTTCITFTTKNHKARLHVMYWFH